MLRELTCREMEYVSGGYSIPPGPGGDEDTFGTGMLSGPSWQKQVMAAFGVLPDGDDDNVIVVMGPERVQLQSQVFGDSYYARYHNGLYYIYNDGYFSDSFKGTFVPDPNGNFPIVSDGFKITINVRGVDITYESIPGSTETWRRVPTPW